MPSEDTQVVPNPSRRFLYREYRRGGFGRLKAAVIAVLGHPFFNNDIVDGYRVPDRSKWRDETRD